MAANAGRWALSARRAIAHGLAWLLLGASAASVAAATTPTAEQLSEEGYGYYTAGRYEAALTAFRRAFDTDPAPVFLYNMGNCLTQLGRHAEAVEAYERYLEDGEDPRLLGQVERLAKAEEAAASRTMTRLAVESDPAGALLVVDDESTARGTTPLRTWLAHGAHRIELRAEDHAPLVRVVRLVPDTLPLLRLALVPESRAGHISVVGAPDGARIEIDDDWVASAPLAEPAWAAAGTRVVRVTPVDGSPTVVGAVVVTAGETLRFDAARPPPELPDSLGDPLVDVRDDARGRDEGFRFPWYAWTTLGVTVVGLGTGVTFTALAVDEAKSARSVSQSGGDPERWRSLADGAEKYETLSWIGYGAAGAGAIATTIILVLENTGGDEPPPNRAVTLLPMTGAAGLELRLGF